MPAQTIPASALVSITPGVIGAGGNALNLVGLVLTKSTRVPIGTVLSLPSYAAVVAYFGSASQEASVAQVYFNGYTNATARPGAILFYQYAGAAVAAYLRGGNAAPLGLAGLNALTGTLTVTVNGTAFTSATINLSGATSFSNAASLILAGFTAPTFAVTFDSQSGAFVFTSSTTGPASTITACTGTISAGLLLTAATGAVLSQGAALATPVAAMPAIVALTTNWATFMTTFEPVTADKIAFATWTNGQNNNFAYVMWTTDVTLTTTVPATASAEYALATGAFSGTFSIYAPTNQANAAALICGIAASINFTATAGRTDFAFSSQSGLIADVNSQLIAANLIANGSNFYGVYGTANQSFNIIYPGQVFGPFLWLDSYIDEIWLNNSLQLALLNLLVNVKSLPYNSAGLALIEAACADPISAALNFGAIRAGVTLSAAQVASVNTAAGFNIATTIQNRGWYLLVQQATPIARAARQSPPCTLFYTDGQSIQQINLASLEVA